MLAKPTVPKLERTEPKKNRIIEMSTNQNNFSVSGIFDYQDKMECFAENPRSKLYKSQHPEFGCVVIKASTRDSADDEIESEIKILRDCQGSNFVVNLHSWTRTPHLIAFTQECCEQGDLFEYLRQFKVSENSIIICMAQIGSALDYIHRVAGVIHEDLKPENIGVTWFGSVKLIDFGCSSRVCDGGVISTSGTVHYASPEKLQRIAHGLEADWWSFGVLFFELVFGYLPFDGDNSKDVAMAVCKSKIEDLCPSRSSNSEHAAWDLIQQLLVKELESRAGVNFGFDQISKHPVFGGLDLKKVLDGTVVPFHRAPLLEYLFM